MFNVVSVALRSRCIRLHRQLHQKALEPLDASDHYGKWRVVRARVVALRGRWRKVGAAPGPTDPIASEEGGKSVVWRTTRQPTPHLPGLEVRCRSGPTDSIASEEERSPWSVVRHGCPSHSPAYVGVPVNGACSTMRVRDHVGGGGELHMGWKPERHVRLVLNNSATSSLRSI